MAEQRLHSVLSGTMFRTALAPILVLIACGGTGPAPQSPTPAGSKVGVAFPNEAQPPVPAPAAEAEPARKPTLLSYATNLGEAAPSFKLQDLDGNTHSLEQYRGQTVVLEWFNPGCPFVKFAHAQGPLKTLARDLASDNLVWLAINSGAPGKQGHGVATNRTATETFAMGHPLLLDEDGSVGRAYGAMKTPHLFVIDGEGKLAYRGGLDNAPMGEVDGEGERMNYLGQALASVRAGKTVDPAETKPYGCTVKYAS